MRTPRPDIILGRHIIIDMSGCDPEIVRNHNLIQEILTEAAEIAAVTVVGRLDHSFRPQGYTAIYLLEESHLSIHTWPELNYVSIDLYSCNPRTDFLVINDYLSEKFQASVSTVTILERGYTERPALDSVPVQFPLPALESLDSR